MSQCPVCLEDKDMKFVRKNEKSDYIKCEKCKSVYLSPMPTVSEMVEYANSHYDSGVYKEYVAARDMKIKSFDYRLQQIRKSNQLQSKNGKIRHLDVGCSCGYMLEVGIANGFDSYGVEFSQSAINAAKDDIKTRIFKCDVNQLKDKNMEKFDLITCYDIVEHIHNPKEFLQTLYDLLNENGCLAITTPDPTHWIAGLMQSRWPMYQPMQHTILFSPEALQSSVTRVGFKSTVNLPAYKSLSFKYLTDQIKILNPILFKICNLLNKILPKFLVERPIFLNISEFLLISKR
jgi:2-polyprenyl-3-methyl-5-hydroxy-6-metoxy-1,4-benzoquinol methylase